MDTIALFHQIMYGGIILSAVLVVLQCIAFFFRNGITLSMPSRRSRKTYEIYTVPRRRKQASEMPRQDAPPVRHPHTNYWLYSRQENYTYQGRPLQP